MAKSIDRQRGDSMRDGDQRAQFVRGVLRRTGSAAAPEWAPSPLARLAGFLAVWLLGLASTLVYRMLHLALSGRSVAGGMTDVLVAIGVAFTLCFIFWHLGRIALGTGFSFARMVWLGSLSAPFFAFLGRVFHPEAESRGWLIIGALMLFAIGMLPSITRIVQGLTRRRRGYDEGHAPYRSIAHMVFEVLLLVGGVFAGTTWFDVIIR